MTPRTPLRAAAALMAVLALALAGCTSTTARTTGTSDGAGVIGIALPSTADAEWMRAGDALSAALRDRGYRVDLQFAADDARTQGAQVQNMRTKGADAVIVAPLPGDVSAAAPPSEGTDPVVLFGRTSTAYAVAFTAVVEPEELGRAQAEALLAELSEATPDAGSDAGATIEPDAGSDPDETTGPDAGTSPDDSAPVVAPARVAVLAATTDDAWERRRYDAAVATLAPAAVDGHLTLVAGATWDEAAVADDPLDVADAAEDRARALGRSDPAPTALLALGDAVTRGVVTAVTTDPPADDDASPSPTPVPSSTAAPAPVPLVVGSGADTVTARALHDGAIAATVFADPRALVPATVDAIDALLARRAPEAGVTSGSPEILRTDDVDTALVDTGWLRADDLSG
ncbi:substrate-binding domain-containing protein [Microbacterium sp. CFBP 8794]|uniref:substrate-binding domain-containing protein n=1 Tax=Microbacterium sp. CFBP 8794 TaxID=2775269 RepID=UPI00177AB7C5|nr:substrate-binding domain-containing protein [Microbacterium sp. CFBP 8794]